jgi:hypothetical protein
MTTIEDRHARFLTSIRPRLDNLAPLMVSEHSVDVDQKKWP